MTPKEAFNVVVKYGFCGDCRWTFEDEHCIKCDCYQRVKFIKEAVDKQTSQKVNKEILTSNAFTQWRRYNCPNCGYFLYSGTSVPFSAQPHCHKCGQSIDWSEEE